MIAGGIVAAGAGAAFATGHGASAYRAAAHYPGVARGNAIQVPVNADGNTADVTVPSTRPAAASARTADRPV
ncbi:chaplin family protein [Streptomyces sp. JV185]|uniref:chaplin family protein n=1 Tax=Streptomyces sp. JV185 TaxID=858638 RepID=UPI003FA6B191